MSKTYGGRTFKDIEELVKMARIEGAKLRYITYITRDSIDLIRASLPKGYFITEPNDIGNCSIMKGGEREEVIYIGDTVVIDMVNKKVALVGGQLFVSLSDEEK